MPGPQTPGKMVGQGPRQHPSPLRRSKEATQPGGGRGAGQSRGPRRASRAWVRRSRRGSTVGAWTPPGLGARAASRRAAARPWAGGAGSTRGQTPGTAGLHGSALRDLRGPSYPSGSPAVGPGVGVTPPTCLPPPDPRPAPDLYPFPPARGPAPVSATDLTICARSRDAGLWAGRTLNGSAGGGSVGGRRGESSPERHGVSTRPAAPGPRPAAPPARLRGAAPLRLG